MINIGKYIETAINWLTNHFATFFDTLSIGTVSYTHLTLPTTERV